jgi:hypothetical protein
MSTRTVDIPPDEWTAFFDRLSERYRGHIVAIEASGSESESRFQLQDVPLDSVSLVLQDHKEAIAIVVREHTLKHTMHTVDVPVRVVYEEAGGVAKSLHLESEDGATTIVRFSSAAVPETVQAQTMPQPDRHWG